MKRGEVRTVLIERLGADGDGLAEVDGRTMRVAGAFPGDLALVRIWRVKRKAVLGLLEGLEARGVERVAPLCPHFGICGGCRWQDIPYGMQCRFKADIVRGMLSGIPGIEPPHLVELVPSPDTVYYRNKMEFSFGSGPGSGEAPRRVCTHAGDTEVRLGLHERGKFDRVFDVTGCRLQSELSNAILDETRRFAVGSGLSVYGLKSHEGLFRYLVIREGKFTGEVMVNLVTSGEEFPCAGEFADMLASRFCEATSVILSINRSPGGVAAGQERRTLRGAGCIHEQIGGLTFTISPDSFFQTNSCQAFNLYDTIREFSGLTGTERLLDLYCGTGTIGIFLSRRAAEVTGVEAASEAVEDARMNAALNDAGNCTFIAGRAEEILEEGMGRFDVAVCDPPRVGIHPKALAALLRMRIPRMVYVSCNAGAIPRDLEMLAMAGYRLVSVRAFDMAPHTPHIETVLGLEIA